MDLVRILTTTSLENLNQILEENGFEIRTDEGKKRPRYEHIKSEKSADYWSPHGYRTSLGMHFSLVSYDIAGAEQYSHLYSLPLSLLKHHQSNQ